MAYGWNIFTNNFDRLGTGGGGGGGITNLVGQDGGTATGTNVTIATAKYGASLTKTLEAKAAGATVTLNNLAYFTPYIVDPNTTFGENAAYQTIQAAINAAVADGATFENPKLVDIRFTEDPYVENLMWNQGVFLRSFGLEQGIFSDLLSGCVIDGSHTLVGDGTFVASGIDFLTTEEDADTFTGTGIMVISQESCRWFNNAGGNVWNVNSAGASHAIFVDCYDGCTQGSNFDFIGFGTVQLQRQTRGSGGVASSWNISAQCVAQDCSRIGHITANSFFCENCSFESSTWNLTANGLGNVNFLVDCHFFNGLGIEETGEQWKVPGCSGDFIFMPATLDVLDTYSVLGNVLNGETDNSGTVGVPAVFNFDKNSISISDTSVPRYYIAGTTPQYGTCITFKDSSLNCSNNPIRIYPQASTGQLIDGLPYWVLDIDGASVELRFNGTNYEVI